MRAMRYFARLRRLGRDRKGASIAELALATPLLVLFLTGLIDLGHGLSERFTLQQAVNRSLELLQAGPLDGDAESEDVDFSQIVAEAAAAADVPTSSVTLTRWLECDNARKSDYDDTCDLGEETARYVQLRIDKTYEGWFFLDGYAMSANGAVRVQ